VIQERTKFTGLDVLVFGALVSFAAWFGYKTSIEFHYSWNWNAIPQYILRFDMESGNWVPGMLLTGLFSTLRISFWATLFALAAGTVMAVLKTGRSRVPRMFATGYVELVRNIPVLVWVFIAYYFIGDRIIPALGLDRIAELENTFIMPVLEILIGNPSQVPVFAAGTAALALYEGAYVTEIIRAGIQSIETGQWEASSALGFTRFQQMKHVIFPQALKNMLPPLAGQIISTIKDSAIVSVISIQELTFQGMELMAATFLTFEIWITIMAIYFVICFCCSMGVNAFENHLKKGRASL